MGSENDHCWSDEEKGTGVGDEDAQEEAETFSRYPMRGPPSLATVTVRQLRSKGLSFQLWPAASAVCCYIENKFRDGGMRVPWWGVIVAPPSILQENVVRDDDPSPSTNLQCNVARSDNLSNVLERDLAIADSLSSVLGRDLTLVNSFSAGLDSDLALVERICSVIGKAAALGENFVLNETQIQNSDDSSEAQVIECFESPAPVAGEIGHRLDRTLANYEPNSRPAKMPSEKCERQDEDDIETSFPGYTEAGNDHLPTRRSMRVLELGSGTGMVGIVAACLGAHVVLTDLPHVIPNVSYNLHLNKGAIDAAGGSVEVKVLRWGVEEDVKALGELSFDLILASDCVYHVTSYKPFLQTLQWLMTGDRDRGSVSMEQWKPKRPIGMHSDSPPQPLRLPVRSPPLTSMFIPSKGTVLPEVNSKLNGKLIESVDVSGELSVSKPAQERSNECVILLGHMRRWKKDATFFRMASKCFNVDVVYRHPLEENARIGPIVYRLSTKSNYKFSTRSSSLTSNRSSSNASSPGH